MVSQRRVSARRRAAQLLHKPTDPGPNGEAVVTQ